MITIFHKTKRGSSIGYAFGNLVDAEKHLIKLRNQHKEATARDDEGRIIAKVWKMDTNWNWFIDTSYCNLPYKESK